MEWNVSIFWFGAEATVVSPPSNPGYTKAEGQGLLWSLNQVKIKDKYGGIVTVTDLALTGGISPFNL